MSETPMIYRSICAAMADIGAIGKEKRNQKQGFMYRGIDDVMNTLSPVLVRHQLFLCPEVLNHRREERKANSGGNLIYSILTMRYTMYAVDGSSVSVTVIGEGMDSADKSSNKAMSVAMKYAMFQLFCIPTEEMVDPDADTPPESTPNSRSNADAQPANQSAPKLDRGAAASMVMDALGISREEFTHRINAAIKSGTAPNKHLNDMTDNEYRALCNAVLDAEVVA